MIILETSRLILRTFRPEDLAALCELYSDWEVRKYFPDGVLTVDETREELEFYLDGGWPEHPQLGLWAVVERSSNTLIGRCGILPWTIDGRTETELAYLIKRSHWRKGFASEAASAVVAHAGGPLGLTRLIALIHENNIASIRTAEKLGFCFNKTITIEDIGAQLYVLQR